MGLYRPREDLGFDTEGRREQLKGLELSSAILCAVAHTLTAAWRTGDKGGNRETMNGSCKSSRKGMMVTWPREQQK